MQTQISDDPLATTTMGLGLYYRNSRTCDIKEKMYVSFHMETFS